MSPIFFINWDILRLTYLLRIWHNLRVSIQTRCISFLLSYMKLHVIREWYEVHQWQGCYYAPYSWTRNEGAWGKGKRFLVYQSFDRGRSERFACKFWRVITVMAVHYSCRSYLRNDLDSIIDLFPCLHVIHSVAVWGLLNESLSLFIHFYRHNVC